MSEAEKKARAIAADQIPMGPLSMEWAEAWAIRCAAAALPTPNTEPAAYRPVPDLPLTCSHRDSADGEEWDEFPPRAQDWIRNAQGWLHYLADRLGYGHYDLSAALRNIQAAAKEGRDD